MGILNLTPDSFSDGGKFLNPDEALKRALELVAQGADIIDIGAESTRPGAKPVSFEEEKERLFPALDEILKEIRIPVSLDTTKSKIAKLGLERGVSIVNDVSGLKSDPDMAQVVREYEAGVVLMHRRGTAETMQSFTHYNSLIDDILDELAESIRIAEKSGISFEQIAIDPGLGFSKTPEQNFEIIKSLPRFKQFKRPIVFGASRKSFLRNLTGERPEDRINASTAIAALAVERGADILRVHDVQATRDAILMTKEIIQ